MEPFREICLQIGMNVVQASDKVDPQDSVSLPSREMNQVSETKGRDTHFKYNFFYDFFPFFIEEKKHVLKEFKYHLFVLYN